MEVEVSTGSSSSSSLVDISLGVHEDAPLSTQGRLESRDDVHDVENISTISGISSFAPQYNVFSPYKHCQLVLGWMLLL